MYIISAFQALHVISFQLWQSAKSLVFSLMIFKPLQLNVFSTFQQHTHFASNLFVQTLNKSSPNMKPWKTLVIISFQATAFFPLALSSVHLLSFPLHFLSQCWFVLMVSNATKYHKLYRINTYISFGWKINPIQKKDTTYIFDKPAGFLIVFFILLHISDISYL